MPGPQKSVEYQLFWLRLGLMEHHLTPIWGVQVVVRIGMHSGSFGKRNRNSGHVLQRRFLHGSSNFS